MKSLRPRRHNPDAPFRFPSGAEAEQAALAARPAVLADPKFRAWFGRSKVVDAEGKPLIVYHGTHAKDAFTIFSGDADMPYRGGLIAFFSSSPTFAEGYGKNVYPVYLRCSDVFDFRDADDATSAVEVFYENHGGVRDDWEARRILMSLSEAHPEIDVIDISDERYSWRDLTEALFLEAVLEGSWPALECEEFVEYLREGWSCDGIVLLEHGAINYGIFDAEQIKSATGNNGAYDGGDPDIRHNPRSRTLSRRLRRNPAPIRAKVFDDLAEAYRTYAQEVGRRDPTNAENERFAQRHGIRFLGSGYTRAVFGVSQGALKVEMGRLPPYEDTYRDNKREAQIWASAPADVARHLVPVLAHAHNYGWLLMPEVEVGGQVTREGREALEGCGITDFWNIPSNVSRDGRLVDYAFTSSGETLRNCLLRGSAEKRANPLDIRHNPRPHRLRRNPEDRAHIRDLLARLQDFKENVMEAAGDDPYETSFDPMDYPIYDDTLASYLGATVLGWGASRVVVLLPSGNVAKLPWSDAYESNEREWENWQEASAEVQQMLLPPLEYVSGVLVFPHVKTVHDRDYDDPELAAARAKWRRLWSAGAPGAKAEDFQNTQNWGIYEGRVVLIDYAD